MEGGNPVKARMTVLIVDRSSSMKEVDENGEPRENIIYRSIVDGFDRFFKALQETIRTVPEVEAMAKATYIALGYFGEEGFDPQKHYLFTLPTGRHVDNLYRLIKVRDKPIIDESQYYGINQNGSDIGQVIRAVKSSIDLVASSAYGWNRDGLRTLVVLLTDGCFNMMEGEMLTGANVYLKVKEAGDRLRSLISGMSRGVITLIYGNTWFPEIDICPIKAALISSRLDEIPLGIKIMLNRLENEGVLERSSDIFNVEVPFRAKNGKPAKVRDYAVWRITDLKLFESYMYW